VRSAGSGVGPVGLSSTSPNMKVPRGIRVR
jgi:hypothetical protein